MTSQQIRQRRSRDRYSASDGGRRRQATCSGAQAARRACHELAEITGLKPEKVTGLEHREDGLWDVTVELLELRRVPLTQDLIGSYEAELDPTGHLLTYHRLARYGRCDPRPAPQDPAEEEQDPAEEDAVNNPAPLAG